MKKLNKEYSSDDENDDNAGVPIVIILIVCFLIGYAYIIFG